MHWKTKHFESKERADRLGSCISSFWDKEKRRRRWLVDLLLWKPEGKSATSLQAVDYVETARLVGGRIQRRGEREPCDDILKSAVYGQHIDISVIWGKREKPQIWGSLNSICGDREEGRRPSVGFFNIFENWQKSKETSLLGNMIWIKGWDIKDPANAGI